MANLQLYIFIKAKALLSQIPHLISQLGNPHNQSHQRKIDQIDLSPSGYWKSADKIQDRYENILDPVCMVTT